MCILLLHFYQVSLYFTEKYFINDGKKSRDTVFTEALLFLWLAETLRNGSEEEYFETLGCLLGDLVSLGWYRKKVKSPQ